MNGIVPFKARLFEALGGRDGDRRSGANDRMVFITNLAYEVRWVELKDILREHGGEVRHISSFPFHADHAELLIASFVEFAMLGLGFST